MPAGTSKSCSCALSGVAVPRNSVASGRRCPKRSKRGPISANPDAVRTRSSSSSLSGCWSAVPSRRTARPPIGYRQAVPDKQIFESVETEKRQNRLCSWPATCGITPRTVLYIRIESTTDTELTPLLKARLAVAIYPAIQGDCRSTVKPEFLHIQHGYLQGQSDSSL